MRRLTQILVLTILWSGGLSLGARTEDEAVVSDPAPSAEVARAQFTLAVVEREPAEAIQQLSNDHRQIYFWTELRNLAGTQVLHRWEWHGQVLAEVPFEVAGPRWRVFSSKQLETNWLGGLTVSGGTNTGGGGAQESFAYTAAEAAPPAGPAPAASPGARSERPEAGSATGP